MRLAIRLAIETRNSIEVLKQKIKETGKFEGLTLTNGFIINQAYLDCKYITVNEKWGKVVGTNSQVGSQIQERYATKTRTDLNVTQETIDGINELKEILPQYTGTKYVTTSYVLKMIVRGSLMIRNNKI